MDEASALADVEPHQLALHTHVEVPRVDGRHAQRERPALPARWNRISPAPFVITPTACSRLSLAPLRTTMRVSFHHRAACSDLSSELPGMLARQLWSWQIAQSLHPHWCVPMQILRTQLPEFRMACREPTERDHPTAKANSPQDGALTTGWGGYVARTNLKGLTKDR
jgi:hypothetical protein